MKEKELPPVKKINKFLTLQGPIPTESDIERVIKKIEEKLSVKEINQNRNFALMEGYTRAIENLKNRESNIEGLKTVQGRAIAAIAFDYLEGLCSEEVLCGIQLKTF